MAMGTTRLCCRCGAPYAVPPTGLGEAPSDYRIFCPMCWRKTSVVARYGVATREVERAARRSLTESGYRAYLRRRFR
jgi:hypothetical protein